MNTEQTNEGKMQVEVSCCGIGAGRWSAFWGIVLIVFGGLGLLSSFIPLQQVGRYSLPVFLVVWGGFILISMRKGRA